MKDELPPLPEPVSCIGYGALIFTHVLPALKLKPRGQINCYAEDDVLAYATVALAAQAAEIEALRADAERYRWLANRVLACDYGDNDAPGKQIGWRIVANLGCVPIIGRNPAFMYGASIDAAIDAARASTTPKD